MASAAGVYVGLISGTSADGIDAAVCEFEPRPRLCEALTYKYPDALRRRILELAQGDGRVALDELGALDVEIAQQFALAVKSVLQRADVEKSAITAIGSHGQTVRHRPRQIPPYTMQLGDANVIAERTGIVTVADFRRRDVAAGGQGAPLAPAFHAAMLQADGRSRVVLNLGGIANITIIPGDVKQPLRGFDTGPASCLLDAWAQEHLRQPFDADGAFAARGHVDEGLLKRMLDDAYFAMAPPKSTGREMFHPAWLRQFLAGQVHAPADVQATLVELTARSIAQAIRAHAPAAVEVLGGGGGVHNPVLMAAIARALQPLPLASTASLGIDPDYVEAMCFAWLARERLSDRAAPNVDTVTGASGPRVLGAVYFGS